MGFEHKALFARNRFEELFPQNHHKVSDDIIEMASKYLTKSTEAWFYYEFGLTYGQARMIHFELWGLDPREFDVSPNHDYGHLDALLLGIEEPQMNNPVEVIALTSQRDVHALTESRGSSRVLMNNVIIKEQLRANLLSRRDETIMSFAVRALAEIYEVPMPTIEEQNVNALWAYEFRDHIEQRNYFNDRELLFLDLHNPDNSYLQYPNEDGWMIRVEGTESIIDFLKSAYREAQQHPLLNRSIDQIMHDYESSGLVENIQLLSEARSDVMSISGVDSVDEVVLRHVADRVPEFKEFCMSKMPEQARQTLDNSRAERIREANGARAA